MDDRVGPAFEHGLANGARVEQVEGDRLPAECPYTLGVSGRPRGADHLVPALDQLSDEPASDRAARSCDEDSHRVLLFGIGVTSPASGGSTCMTRCDKGM
jgi:hypothetical protein